jgi:predicted DNA-binding ribbon-helix-helix protein
MSNDKTSIPLTLTNEEWYTLMTMAHERDITLNQMVEDILWTYLKDLKNESIASE